MKISYGPPGARGVSTLMAVGASDIDQTPTDRAVQVGGWVSLAAAIGGAVIGSKTIRDLGLGGAIALFAVRAVTNAPQQVAVTTPIPPTNPTP